MSICPCVVVVLVLSLALVFMPGARAAEPGPDMTCFQVAAPYSPELDIGADLAIVYGVNDTFAERVEQWRSRGYSVSMMTGIAWGGYGDYYMRDGELKKDEIQTVKSGRLFMHGDSTTVGYNVPSPEYVEYIKRLMDPAIEAGVQGIYLEEPEYWAKAGWSEGFKKEWQRFYGEPWQPPDSSPDAQYRASKLKYELYFNALKEVFAYIREQADAKGLSIECHVPTHSMINYAHWRIVSPESHLIDIPQLDGYIAQVWTGTARTPNIFRGVPRERTFESAFLEYGQMYGMVRPTGKKVWFLHDPVEDNPNRSWNDYKRNYECTLVASLLWPGVSRYEVMPWPDRIFKGAYPPLDMDLETGRREGIPADYATQIAIAVNALSEMDQTDIRYDAGTRGIGIVVSDTMMFQRADPHPSDAALGSFYGLALPLVKAGVPLEVVQLENTIYPECLEGVKVLLLTYEGQKPLKPDYHEALDAWVRAGGLLLFVEDGSDPYHGVREWWNAQATTTARAYDDLFERLGLTEQARREPQPVGRGHVRVLEASPRDLQREPDAPERILAWVDELLRLRGESLETRNHIVVRRGPFVVAAVLDESVSEEPLVFDGVYVDLFDPMLPVVTRKTMRPDERALLFDVAYARNAGMSAKVVGAGARIRGESLEDGAFSFVARGPAAVTANMRLMLPARPGAVTFSPETEFRQEWDETHRTLWLSFDNRAADVAVRVAF